MVSHEQYFFAIYGLLKGYIQNIQRQQKMYIIPLLCNMRQCNMIIFLKKVLILFQYEKPSHYIS